MDSRRSAALRRRPLTSRVSTRTFHEMVRPSFTQIDDAAAAARVLWKRSSRQEACPEGCRPADQGRHRSYDGIYIAGGHGCMEDMPASPAMTGSCSRCWH